MRDGPTYRCKRVQRACRDRRRAAARPPIRGGCCRAPRAASSRTSLSRPASSGARRRSPSPICAPPMKSCSARRRVKYSPSPRSMANRSATASRGPCGASSTTPSRRTSAKSRGRRGERDIHAKRAELLKFPTTYPIKVVGRRSEHMRANIDAIVRAHVPDLDGRSDQGTRQQPAALPRDHLHDQCAEQGTDRRARHALQASKDVIMLI